MRIALAQLNPTMGDPAANARAVLDALAHARRGRASLVLTPELSLCGYPPEDLVLRSAFIDDCARELGALAAQSGTEALVVGFPEREEGRRYNSVAVLRGGRVEAVYRKHALPNYTVFDEVRYFEPGTRPCVIDVDGLRVGLAICEDMWLEAPARQARDAGAQVLAVSNGSPYHTRQQALRLAQASARARECSIPVVYVNRVGGQDELVFDGASFVVDREGALAQQAPAWHEAVVLCDFDGDAPRPVRGTLDPATEPHVYEALVTGVRDYMGRNGFPGAIVGLSGGVDSALTLAVAVDALGPRRVRAVMMPSPFNAPMSLEDARSMAQGLGVRYDEIPIDGPMAALERALAGELRGLAPDATEENLQARIRGTILMALSNKHGGLVLTTGNKSEMAVGYATLYGDMAGGFAVLKDVTKTLVYRLCAYRNAHGRVIPEHLTRAPSANSGQGRSTRIRCRLTTCSTASSRRTSSGTRPPRGSSRPAMRRGTSPGSWAS